MLETNDLELEISNPGNDGKKATECTRTIVTTTMFASTQGKLNKPGDPDLNTESSVNS